MSKRHLERNVAAALSRHASGEEPRRHALRQRHERRTVIIRQRTRAVADKVLPLRGGKSLRQPGVELSASGTD